MEQSKIIDTSETYHPPPRSPAVPSTPPPDAPPPGQRTSTGGQPRRPAPLGPASLLQAVPPLQQVSPGRTPLLLFFLLFLLFLV